MIVEVQVDARAWEQVAPGAAELARRAAELALEGVGPPNEVAVLLADDQALQALNARWRGKDAPTNVLSFPADSSAAPHLGDLALAYGVCAAEAQAQGKALGDHLQHLVVHGVLHLLGFDHESDEAGAEEMEALERTVLARLGIADPYAAERDAVGRG